MDCSCFPKLKALDVYRLLRINNLEKLELLQKLIITNQSDLEIVDTRSMRHLKYLKINNRHATTDVLQALLLHREQKIDFISITNCVSRGLLTLPDYAGDVCVVIDFQIESANEVLFFGKETDPSYYPRCRERCILGSKDQNISYFGGEKKVGKNRRGKSNAALFFVIPCLIAVACGIGFHSAAIIKYYFQFIEICKKRLL